MQKYTYRVFGIKSTVVYTDFHHEGITIEVMAKRIPESVDKIRQYLADNHLKADSTTLIKIELA